MCAKTIYYVYSGACGEYDFFFDDKFELIHYWHQNDANYRTEYMNPFLRKIGIIVETGNDRDERFWSQIKKVLIGDGASEEDLER